MSVILITGCSTGFGLRSAVTFANKGHDVFASVRNPANATALNDAARAARSSMRVISLDVTDAASVNSAVDEVRRTAGGLDVVVNNAGIEVYGAVHLLADDEMRDSSTRTCSARCASSGLSCRSWPSRGAV